ncbi:SAM-dependent methyltransferase [Phytoactinopolyspora endophytica]|uniref:SAM-dependent methyltransferase n=1 Tax=Phytoactinopolyspora endophytica TaxID=1642495 RepID=UPI00101B8DD9|nr:methyltransferase domain-containing protein [Phytoactinopolyspora endophytica]
MAHDEARAHRVASHGQDAVALLLGSSYRPGGLALTRRLARQLRLVADERVLVVGSGRGASAVVLAQEFGTRVQGIDVSAANVALASGAAAAAGLRGRVSFVMGGPRQLPAGDAELDAVVWERACGASPSGSTVAELERVLRPGGRVGITDAMVEPDRVSPESTRLAGQSACVADLCPAEAYVGLFNDVGMSVTHIEPHDAVMIRMLDQVEARLAVVQMTSRTKAEALGIDFERAGPALAAARSAVAAGALSYILLVAEKQR